jgi:hypothetical protein
MTVDHRRTITQAFFWLSIGCNLVAAIATLVIGSYALAAVQTALVAGLFFASWMIARYDQLFDARIRKAQADRDMSEMAYAEVKRQIAAGHASIHGNVRREWAN